MSEYENCVEIIDAEMRVLSAIVGVQGDLRGAVVNKKWADFEGFQDSLKAAGDKLTELEAERARLFPAEHEPGNNGSTAFYTFILRFSSEERDFLSGLYRQLKLLSAKVRYENDALNQYLGETCAVVSLFLEAAFPDRRGKLYSRHGTTRSADMRSMVLDRRF
jgi:hypothetical protein